MRDWRPHPLLRFDSVKRWMFSLKCKDSSKRQYVQSFSLFLRDVNVENPDSLIDDYIRDMKSDDPRVRLHTQDRVNAFFEQAKQARGEYQAWHCLVSVRSFYSANGCPVMVSAPFPKVPIREQSERTLVKVKELTPAMLKFARPVLRSLILTLAESGMRIASALQIRYRDIKDDYESNTIPMAIRLHGRITKTGLSCWAFILDDARDAIRDQLEMRSASGEMVSDDTLVFL